MRVRAYEVAKLGSKLENYPSAELGTYLNISKRGAKRGADSPETKKAHRKVSLSRCSVWCRHQESNPGPTDYKSVALPSELYRRVRATIIAIGWLL